MTSTAKNLNRDRDAVREERHPFTNEDSTDEIGHVLGDEFDVRPVVEPEHRHVGVAVVVNAAMVGRESGAVERAG